MEVIQGNLKEKESVTAIYSRAIERFFEKHMGAVLGEDNEVTKKFLFLAVKYEAERQHEQEKVKTKEKIEADFRIFSILTDLLSGLTPKEFTQMFPIDKTYDGEKYGIKDYFSTIKAIKKIGPDTVIGSNRIMEFLWDYQNRDIRNFEVNKMCTLSDMRRLEGHKGLMEEFMEAQGVPSYTLHEKEGCMVNNMTGEVLKISKPKKRVHKYLKVL